MAPSPAKEPGRQQGPIVAGDPSCLVPEDAAAFRKLARELLCQAARDLNGKGYAGSLKEQREAHAFFYSPKCRFLRECWFGMAGVEIPTMDQMPKVVKILYLGSMKRRSGEKAPVPDTA